MVFNNRLYVSLFFNTHTSHLNYINVPIKNRFYEIRETYQNIYIGKINPFFVASYDSLIGFSWEIFHHIENNKPQSKNVFAIRKQPIKNIDKAKAGNGRELLKTVCIRISPYFFKYWGCARFLGNNQLLTETIQNTSTLQIFHSHSAKEHMFSTLLRLRKGDLIRDSLINSEKNENFTEFEEKIFSRSNLEEARRRCIYCIPQYSLSEILCSPKHICSKKDQRLQGVSWLMIPQIYSTTPAYTQNIIYIKLIIQKIGFKQKIVFCILF